jgi:hypothetical protein
LSVVSPRDFEIALADPAANDDKINDYLRGIFASWEPIPDWFAKVLEVSGQAAVSEPDFPPLTWDETGSQLPPFFPTEIPQPADKLSRQIKIGK